MDYTLNNATGDTKMEHFCLRDDRDTKGACGEDYKCGRNVWDCGQLVI